MIQQLHPRGRGGKAGPVDYLLGKTASATGPSSCRESREEVRELIDLAPRQALSGVLSLLNRIYRPASVKS
ncbi:hypothetical protein [Klebsiella pneumoniae]|uniref:hypothetical protein n=1 Tax=Klebsiella pneumoniae TaxID=573 RepID=UPI0022B645AB|nr:hypothetical protein [Klebsiella pneumoniae]